MNRQPLKGQEIRKVRMSEMLHIFWNAHPKPLPIREISKKMKIAYTNVHQVYLPVGEREHYIEPKGYVTSRVGRLVKAYGLTEDGLEEARRRFEGLR